MPRIRGCVVMTTISIVLTNDWFCRLSNVFEAWPLLFRLIVISQRKLTRITGFIPSFELPQRLCKELQSQISNAITFCLFLVLPWPTLLSYVIFYEGFQVSCILGSGFRNYVQSYLGISIVPTSAFSLLLQYFLNELAKNEKTFCKDGCHSIFCSFHIPHNEKSDWANIKQKQARN